MPEKTPKLVGEALREAADLAQQEFALFRAEMSENVRTIATGLVTVIAAAVLAILSLIWLTQALVDWLTTKVGLHALAALIVGGVLAVIAVGLGLYGRSAIARASCVPKHTVASLKQDKDVLTVSASK